MSCRISVRPRSKRAPSTTSQRLNTDLQCFFSRRSRKRLGFMYYFPRHIHPTKNMSQDVCLWACLNDPNPKCQCYIRGTSGIVCEPDQDSCRPRFILKVSEWESYELNCQTLGTGLTHHGFFRFETPPRASTPSDLCCRTPWGHIATSILLHPRWP